MSLAESLGQAGGHLIEDVRNAVKGQEVTGIRFTVVANITAPFSLILLNAELERLIGPPIASNGRAIPPVDVSAAFPEESLPKDLYWTIGAVAPIQELAAYLLVGDKVRVLGRRTTELKADKLWRGDRTITSTLLEV